MQVVLPDRFEKCFTNKYTIVKDYCRRFRKAQTKKATIRVEHTIGLSAQVDWKEHVTMTDWNGVSHTFSIFLYVLPYSKFKFLKLTLNQRQESLKRRIKRARFPIVKRLSDFNYQFQPSVNRQQIDSLRPCHFWIIKRTLSLLAILAWAKHT
ncbi:ATP-binding protein [Ligilactobacillus ruminis]|uniref:ATP-binding protein n=1 Tax=Ligilactobacillus ruminis TaxID=1623 RepID=UPI003D045793